MPRSRHPRNLAGGGLAMQQKIAQALKKTQQPERCPIHGIPYCSPLLNGCSWKPTKGGAK